MLDRRSRGLPVEGDRAICVDDGTAAQKLAQDGGRVPGRSGFSYSHAASFRHIRARRIGRAKLIHKRQTGADHPTLSRLAKSGYLKSLFFWLD